MKTSVFKTAEGRDKVLTYYNRILSQFPFGQQYIQTSFGQTFMLTAGRETNPPVILLHGSCSNSAFWFPEITALSEHFRVYAVDIIGEAGNSEEYRPEVNSNVFALWVKDILNTLGLEKAILIGNSLGGWMALKFATAYPECVSSLVLIASSGLAPINLHFVNAMQKNETGFSGSVVIQEQELPKVVLDFINLIVENYNPIQDLPLYTNEQIQNLTMPVLFIGGEEDVLINAQESAQRLSRLVPSADIRLLPHFGHVITNSIKYILPFLMQKSPV